MPTNPIRRHLRNTPISIPKYKRLPLVVSQRQNRKRRTIQNRPKPRIHSPRLRRNKHRMDCEGGRPRLLIQRQIQGAHKQAVCAYSTSRIKHESYWKPGGTMTAVCNPWNGHILDKGADNRMGNWSYVNLRGK
jgi:hypothetical protein